MTAILGLSAFYHDSAAALIIDGEIVAAAQEERFSRRKHDHRFPQNALDYCLDEAGLKPADLDYVAYYEKPISKFERLLETYLSYAPSGYRSFRKALPQWVKQKLHLPRELGHGLRGEYGGRYVFTSHHEAHAASAFFPSPFDQAAILTLDGVGEWATSCVGIGRGNRIELMDEIRFPHSIGLLYSAMTYYTGFRVNSGEYKLMGLAPYGNPVYHDAILDHLIDLKVDGSFRLDMSYFNYCQGLTMTSKKFHRLMGGPPRKPETELTQRHMDLAASIQSVTEEVMLRMSRHAHERTGCKNLVLAGGVALNCVGNGKILREGPFDQLWVQPAAGDAGGALGTALFTWHQLLDRPRAVLPRDSQKGSFLGPQYSDEQIAATLDEGNAKYSTCDSAEQLCDLTARLIAEQNVVGWFQGRLEFGPRALGARSILGDPRNPKMQSIINAKIKFRESFRPFAPIVLEDRAAEYFQTDPSFQSPYMLLVAPVRDELRCDSGDLTSANGLERLQAKRTEIPAVTHVDLSARIQTLDADRNPLMYQLVRHFDRQTGCPLLINTSFNVRGEPIVCRPEDALRCFRMTDMDVLVLGRHVLLKREQERSSSESERDRYRTQFALD